MEEIHTLYTDKRIILRTKTKERHLVSGHTFKPNDELH